MIVTPGEWWSRVISTGCLMHDDPVDCAGLLQAHHIITQQALKKRGLHGRLWDVRNGMCLCEQSHRRHTLAVERIPFDRLPERAVAFATELGLDWMLERYYPAIERSK